MTAWVISRHFVLAALAVTIWCTAARNIPPANKLCHMWSNFHLRLIWIFISIFFAFCEPFILCFCSMATNRRFFVGKWTYFCILGSINSLLKDFNPLHLCGIFECFYTWFVTKTEKPHSFSPVSSAAIVSSLISISNPVNLVAFVIFFIRDFFCRVAKGSSSPLFLAPSHDSELADFMLTRSFLVKASKNLRNEQEKGNNQGFQIWGDIEWSLWCRFRHVV